MPVRSPVSLVNVARLAIMWVGFGWPVLGLAIGLEKGIELVWVAIGTVFMGAIFGLPALLLGLALPAYKHRIFIIPISLFAIFWALSRQSATYQGLTLPPFMFLWIVTFTAISLLPQQRSNAASEQNWKSGWRRQDVADDK
ncbi:hypothetical protein AB8A31_09855 [Tardiphaga sp. 804_B3_N1_9]|uniref:hypothetical protein n=1 Tax=Tardiphaga TaxID=1395974 RepID=UPI00158609C1|nr:hypothetical protein [Tardiphaga robiniae]NUU39890.1 hypothetical protein [Tardiphaga robiniae]